MILFDNDNSQTYDLQPSKDDIRLSEQQNWRQRLTPEQYDVCIKRGTEKPFSGEYYEHNKLGTYHCLCCGVQQPLFESTAKFSSGTGWPSFAKPITDAAVTLRDDDSLFMHRIEVSCSQCNAHLGHVFDDGPNNGKRYCINSVALKFFPQ